MRLHLNIYDDLVVLDEDGSSFEDLSAAADEAICGAREMMAAALVAGRPIRLHHRIEITDDAGVVLAVIPFRDLLTIEA